MGRTSIWLNDQKLKLFDTEGKGTVSYELSDDTLANVQTLFGEKSGERLADVDYETSDEEQFARPLVRASRSNTHVSIIQVNGLT